MKKINKIDYFVGVFLSAILKSSKTVPALFDQASESKKVEFETNNNAYNVYIKYSTTKNIGKANHKGQKRVSWNIAITDSDYEKLRDFYQADSKNYIAVVCTNDKLTDTRIVILDYDKVIGFSQRTPAGKQKRISIFRYGKEHKFHYKGAGCADSESKECDIEFMSYFQ